MSRFSMNELVWAKVKGYPWWPALISCYKNSKDQYTCVTNFPKYNEIPGELEEIQLFKTPETSKCDSNSQFDYGKRKLAGIRPTSNILYYQGKRKLTEEHSCESFLSLSQINERQKIVKVECYKEQTQKNLSCQTIQFQVLEIELILQIQKINQLLQLNSFTEISEILNKILEQQNKTLKYQSEELNYLLFENSWGKHYEMVKLLVEHKQFQEQIKNIGEVNNKIQDKIIQQFFGNEEKQQKMQQITQMQVRKPKTTTAPQLPNHTIQFQTEITNPRLDLSQQSTQSDHEKMIEEKINEGEIKEKLINKGIENLNIADIDNQIPKDIDNQDHVKNPFMRQKICVKLSKFKNKEGASIDEGKLQKGNQNYLQ